MKLNKAVVNSVFTHEGGKADMIGAVEELRRTLMTCLLWEDTFYEKGDSVAGRMAQLVPVVPPEAVVALAIKARNEMRLRHAPLFLLRELAKIKGTGRFVEQGLNAVIQRADEMGEFLAMYWKEKRQPVSAAVKRALATKFPTFNEYQLAKYNSDDAAVKLRDVMFVCHPKPIDAAQAAMFKQIVEKTLAPPDTWEVALSAGKDKKEVFERLLREKKLGGLAALKNLRNMQQAGVDDDLIRERLADGIKWALPFRFITAARYAPTLEDALEQAMFKGIEEMPRLRGKTGLLVDVSGSMDDKLSDKGDTLRVDAACGLAVLLRELGELVKIATFSNNLVTIPPRRGFALRDAILQSQMHSSTNLREALELLRTTDWAGFDRLIVITDEQSHDGVAEAFVPNSYIINVAGYQHGVGYHRGWQHVSGWSERVFDYIQELERNKR